MPTPQHTKEVLEALTRAGHGITMTLVVGSVPWVVRTRPHNGMLHVAIDQSTEPGRQSFLDTNLRLPVDDAGEVDGTMYMILMISTHQKLKETLEELGHTVEYVM